ncbi:MAG: 50S ribosomal protein L15 [Flexibacteraceae bacterium]|jgi:large subunit ribosomal protein L15
MELHNLRPAAGSTHTKKRLGRGTGSGMGGTSTRGHKGAQSRSGYSAKSGFEGGQMPLQRRVPKFGFKNINRVEYKVINLDTIQTLADSFNVSTIDIQFLLDHGMVAKKHLVKVLGRGELKSGITVTAHAFSSSAIAAIEKAGGSTNVIAA